MKNLDQGKLIKTFVVGFEVSGNTNNYTTAQQQEELIALYLPIMSGTFINFNRCNQTSYSGRLTLLYTCEDVQNFVYQATFEYASNKQWEGTIKNTNSKAMVSLGL